MGRGALIRADRLRTFALGLLLAIGLLGQAGGAAASGKAKRVLVIGDSLMAIHSITGHSVGGALRRMIGGTVVNRSVLGARMIYWLPITGSLGMSIPAQFRGDWDWVVMNGGGNDLWFGCGCSAACSSKLNLLISDDGSRGAIPKLFARILASKARVVYVGYLRSPGIWTPIDHCKKIGDQFEDRVARLAARVPGVHYLSNQDLVPRGDTSYFGIDGIHPSIKASRAIAARIAGFLARVP